MTLKLKPNPTFKAKVCVPCAGGEQVEIEFEFRHMSRTDLDAYRAELGELNDRDAVLRIVCGWEGEEPFGPDVYDSIVEDLHAAPGAIVHTYLRELLQLREGN